MDLVQFPALSAFSHAARLPKEVLGFSTCGMVWIVKNLPSAAKADAMEASLTAQLKLCPFKAIAREGLQASYDCPEGKGQLPHHVRRVSILVLLLFFVTLFPPESAMESFFVRYRNLLVLLAILLVQIIGLAVQVRRTAGGRSSTGRSRISPACA